MINSAVATLVLLGASAAASSVGSAHVVNKCNYPVTLCNTPSSGGGYEQEDKTLSPGESWEQTWTELSNGNGWSIKLSKTESLSSNILQYEYTYHEDGIIWYDLSCVDGNPWDQDWEITANGTECNPKQQAYRYSTDDAYGMQSCPSEAVITVTLCTGTSADNGNSVDSPSSGGNSGSAPVSSSAPAPAPVYSAPPPVYSAPAPAYSAPSTTSTTVAPAAPTPHAYNWNKEDVSKSLAADTTPTTLATVTTPAGGDPYAVTITAFETAYITAEVTAYNRHRRHEHHARGHGGDENHA